MSTIFTKIIEGEIPGRFVWKDEHCVAFLDIMPLSEGHLRTGIPKDGLQEALLELFQILRHRDQCHTAFPQLRQPALVDIELHLVTFIDEGQM